MSAVRPFVPAVALEEDEPMLLPEWDGSLALWDALFPVRFAVCLSDEAQAVQAADCLLYIEPFFSTDMDAVAALIAPLAHGRHSFAERWEGEPATLARLQADPLLAQRIRLDLAHRFFPEKLGIHPQEDRAALVRALALRLTPEEGGIT